MDSAVAGAEKNADGKFRDGQGRRGDSRSYRLYGGKGKYFRTPYLLMEITRHLQGVSYSQLESLTQPELASRLTMNCVNCYVQPQKICHLPVTIIDVFDEYALSNSVREEMYKCYPNAKLAHLKSGGNFPYLSRSISGSQLAFTGMHMLPYAIVNLYIDIKAKRCVYRFI